MQDQQSKTKEEWKTHTFDKGKKKLTINESKETPSRAGINVNIFDATTGKFFTSQTLNHKARPKQNSLGDNRTRKKLNAEEYSINEIDINSKNHFSALME